MAAASSRPPVIDAVRPRSPSPAPSGPQKRRRLNASPASNGPDSSTYAHAALDLALAHLLHDSADHPLYQRNLDQVLDGYCRDQDLKTAIDASMENIVDHVRRQASSDSQRRSDVEIRLRDLWLRRVLEWVGATLSETAGFSSGAPLNMSVDIPQGCVQLKVVPVVEVLEDEDDQGEKRVDSGVEVEDESDDEDEIEEGESGEDQNEDEEPAAEDEDEDADAHEDEDDDDDDEESVRGEDGPGREEPPAQVHTVRAVRRFKIPNEPPSRLLLLREPNLDLSKDPSRTPPAPDVKEIRAALTDALGPLRAWHMQMNKYALGTWLLTFKTAGKARQACGKGIYVRQRRTQLAPFTPNKAQVYHYQNLPKDLDEQAALRGLVGLLPDHTMYVMKSTKRDQNNLKGLLVMLGRPSDIEAFKLPIPRKGRKSEIVAKFQAYVDGYECLLCQQQHPLYLCPKFCVLRSTTNLGPGLMSTPPYIPISSAYDAFRPQDRG